MRCRHVAVVATYAVAALGLLVVDACHRADPAATPASAVAQTSASCRECHENEFKAWQGTDHALANHVFDPESDAEALALFRKATAGSRLAAPEFVLGHKPLWQFLVPMEGGRWQPHELAFDPQRKELFNVFGDENRRAGEWGHWTGRGMNWNSMCAHCHMTAFHKNYDPATDSYRSTWVEHGIGCIQCHGVMPASHGKNKNPPPKPPLTPEQLQAKRQVAMQTCAPCHARNELLTGEFQPGDNYFDHHRVTLPVEPGVYWPDGQQRDEDFNWTSVLLSRMAHAGVTCMDCHDAHTTKTILPAADNTLCMQCHTAPGRVMPVSGVTAPPIDPTAHSHHKPDSTGNSCIACHMPTTNYMQRAPRHDHGWLLPDPLLTKELGIPNACSRCHSDQPIEWSIDAAEKWYGSKLIVRQRARARAVHAAQVNEAGAPDRLLGLLTAEDIPAWKATYLELLARVPVDEAKAGEAGRLALKDADPMVRSAAVDLLASHPNARAVLQPFLADPSRQVRLSAAWALSGAVPLPSPVKEEYARHLAVMADQPTGQLRIGQDLANRRLMDSAEGHFRKAVEWDQFSPGIRDSLGMLLSAQGRSAEAAAAFYRAGQLNPADAEAMYRAGLAYAEAGMPAEAETSLRAAVQRRPQFDRAWYNLGLLLSRSGRVDDALAALAKAEAIAPHVADYPYAAATIHWQKGDRNETRAAAERALRADPGYEPAQRLLQSGR